MKTIYTQEMIPQTGGKETLVHHEIVEHNGRKFRIFIEGSDYTCLGFNNKCCVKVMNANGSWDNVVDNQELAFPSYNDILYYGRDVNEKKRIVNNLVKKLKEYISAVY